MTKYFSHIQLGSSNGPLLSPSMYFIYQCPTWCYYEADFTPLIWASSDGSLEMVKTLVAAGANLEKGSHVRSLDGSGRGQHWVHLNDE